MKSRLSLLVILGLLLTMMGGILVRAQDLSGQLEIFSWWAGDEGPALEALLALYSQQNPNV